MSFTTNPYCTTQQVISALDPASTSLPTDSWLEELILEAQNAIDVELGFPFQTDGTTLSPAQRLYDGTGEGVLLIDDCISISSVVENVYNVIMGTQGNLVQGTTQTLDITADIKLGPSALINNYGYGITLRRKTGLPFQEGLQNYTVNGVFGRPSIPPLITRACVRLAVHFYKMRDTNYADQIIEQGQVRMKYNKPFPEDVVEILGKFKRRVFLSRS